MSNVCHDVVWCVAHRDNTRTIFRAYFEGHLLPVAHLHFLYVVIAAVK